MKNKTDTPDRLGFCGRKDYGQIRATFIGAYRGQGHPPLTEWDLEIIHRRWTRIGKQVAAGARITGR